MEGEEFDPAMQARCWMEGEERWNAIQAMSLDDIARAIASELNSLAKNIPRMREHDSMPLGNVTPIIYGACQLVRRGVSPNATWQNTLLASRCNPYSVATIGFKCGDLQDCIGNVSFWNVDYSLFVIRDPAAMAPCKFDGMNVACKRQAKLELQYLQPMQDAFCYLLNLEGSQILVAVRESWKVPNPEDPEDGWLTLKPTAAAHGTAAIDTMAYPRVWPRNTDLQRAINHNPLNAENVQHPTWSSDYTFELDRHALDPFIRTFQDYDSTTSFNQLGLAAMPGASGTMDRQQRITTLPNLHQLVRPLHNHARLQYINHNFPTQTEEHAYVAHELIQEPNNYVITNNVPSDFVATDSAKARDANTPARTLDMDSPWSEREGLPPPYELSPRVFFGRRQIVTAKTPTVGLPWPERR
jgi:hypothetical protein